MLLHYQDKCEAGLSGSKFVYRSQKGKGMIAERHLRRLLISVLATALVVPVMPGAEPSSPVSESVKATFGAIVGVVRSATKAPVGGATLTAVRGDGSGVRATVSGSDGVYSFPDLTPGAWSITSQADGYSDTGMASLEVTAGRATRSDIAMTANVPVQPAVISSNQAAPTASTAWSASRECVPKCVGTPAKRAGTAQSAASDYCVIEKPARSGI